MKSDKVFLAGICLVGVFALSFAWVAEHVLGLVPCILCLMERWPYRFLIVLGLIGFCLPARIRSYIVMCAALVMAVNIGIALLHTGVEHQWWRSPFASCQAQTLQTGSISERLRFMPDKPAKPCDSPDYLIPHLPISMTEMDLIFSSTIFLILVFGGVYLYKISHPKSNKVVCPEPS